VVVYMVNVCIPVEQFANMSHMSRQVESRQMRSLAALDLLVGGKGELTSVKMKLNVSVCLSVSVCVSVAVYQSN